MLTQTVKSVRDRVNSYSKKIVEDRLKYFNSEINSTNYHLLSFNEVCELQFILQRLSNEKG